MLRNTGFTYIELLIAISMIAIVLLGSAQVYLRIQNQQKIESEKLKVRRVLDELIDFSFSQGGLNIFQISNWNSTQLDIVIQCHLENCNQQDVIKNNVIKTQQLIRLELGCSEQLITEKEVYLQVKCKSWEWQYLVSSL